MSELQRLSVENLAIAEAKIETQDIVGIQVHFAFRSRPFEEPGTNTPNRLQRLQRLKLTGRGRLE